MLNGRYVGLFRIEATEEIILGTSRGKFLLIDAKAAAEMGEDPFAPDPELKIVRLKVSPDGLAEAYYIPYEVDLFARTSEATFREEQIPLRLARVGDWLFKAGFGEKTRTWVVKGELMPNPERSTEGGKTLTYQEHIAALRRFNYAPQLVALHLRFGLIPNETCGGCARLQVFGGSEVDRRKTNGLALCSISAVSAPWKAEWPACGSFSGTAADITVPTERPPIADPFEEVE